MKYDCIIIGSGFGGLIAALKLVKEGRRVLVLEQQNAAGGYGAGFQRAGFKFDSSIHIADALGPGGDIYEMLGEFDLVKELDIVSPPEFCRLIYPEHDMVVPKGITNFKKLLKENFADEARNIDKLFLKMQKLNNEFHHYVHSGLPSCLKFLFFPLLYPTLITASSSTLEQFISQYTQNKKLKALVGNLWGFFGLPPEKLSALYYIVAFLEYYESGGYYIRGTFSHLVEAMVKKIREFGGEIKLNTSVEKILTEKGKVVRGVATDSGEELEAEAVISNANAIDTLAHFIDSDGLKQEYSKLLSGMEKSVSATQVYLGMDISAKELGMKQHNLTIHASYDGNQEYARILGKDYTARPFSVMEYSQLDPDLSDGKTKMVIIVLDNFLNWKGLSKEAYQEKKKEVAETLIKRAEQYIPYLSKHIRVMEVATPLTMARYTSSPDGAIYGFAQTPGQAGNNRLPQETRIKNLYLAGAWTFPGAGVHGACASGYLAAGKILRKH